MNLNEYQEKAKLTDQRKTKDEVNTLIPLLGLIGELGSAASEYKKRIRDKSGHSTFNDRLAEELGDVLWYVSILAADNNLDLEGIAELNLEKVKDRWPIANGISQIHPLFDGNFPEHEQLPRYMEILFKENSDGKVCMYYAGKQIGDPLTNNSHDEDGYRYHDVMHLAFAAIIGWSPVLRSKDLLYIKRKSQPAFEEVEDGARAGIIEEALVHIIHDYAEKHNYFEGIERIDFEFLKMIKNIVQNLEVRVVSSQSWERAILDGFKIFRAFHTKKTGTVILNLNERTIKLVD